MATYIKGCFVKTKTAARDITPSDFRLTTGTPVANGANWDIPLALKTAAIGDVENFVNVGSVTLKQDPTTTVIQTGPISAGAPGQLNFTFTNVAATPTNTGNKWLLTLTNLQVVTKGGQTVTKPSVTVAVDSPF